jgi:small redox-active disulfide protein 2
MKIQVLGSGCASCKKLHELASEIVQELNLDVKVDYITDISKIVELGIMQSPVLTVNGKPVMVGFIPNKEKIKDAIIKGIQ